MIGSSHQGGSPPRLIFDQKPIGQKKTFDIPQYAQNEDPNAIQQNYNPEPRPLGERLKKKILKIRRQAVDELLGLVRNDPKEYQQYESMTLELISFIDSQVQDKSLKIIILYLSAGLTLSIDPRTMIKTIIEKCLCIEKEDIKANSEEILFWYMDNKNQDLLLAELNDNLLHRNKKIIAVSLLFIANLLHNYGLKRLKGMQRFSKNLDLMSAPAKPNAKAESIVLFKQIYRWMGEECLKEFKMHAEVKDDVVKFAQQYQRVPMEIKRGIKKQPMVNGQHDKPVYEQQDQGQNKEPVDVLSYATAQWVDNLFKLEKWKQKKEVLDQFIKKIKVPCILPPRQMSHFIFLIKKLLSDNNVNICYCGFHIIQHMAKGLRKDFAHIARNILGDLFGKLKELKAMTVDLAQKSIKSLLYSLSLEDFMEYIKDGLKDKSPVMKEQVLKLINHFATKKDSKTISLLRALIDKIVALTEDSTVKVRNQAFDVLVTLKATHSMKFFGDKLRALDNKKLQTLELAKAPNQSESIQEVEEVTMVIPQVLPPPAQVMNKEANTNRIKASKSVDIEQPKNLKGSRIAVKNDDSSSIASNGQYKVPRSLNLNFMDELSAPNQHIRTNAYQQIANKYLTKDIKQFLRQIKNTCSRESNPTILKFILQIAKKYINGGLGDFQLAQFLAKHDWKRGKNLLQEFLQVHKFTPEADDVLRSIVGLNNSNVKNHQTHTFPLATNTSSSPSFKGFCIELQNTLISKMSSPIEQIKKQAAERAIKIWQEIPKINNENELTATNGWQEDYITKFFNIIKYRLSDSPEVVSLYCQLLVQMLHKGINLKQRHMKSVLHSVFSNLSRGLPCMIQLFKEMVINSPSQIFMSMQSQIFIESTQPVLIEFLHENSDMFIKYADLKVFLAPFLHILCGNSVQMKYKQFLDNLFHQMVQILGEPVLEKQISKIKVSNAQIYNQYLQKYNMALNKSSQSQSSSRNYRFKQDRLKYWEQEGWHLQITSNHILKLANMMINLGEPICSLCNFFYLSPQNLKDLHAFDYMVLADFSDVFFKFIYWRVAIDCRETVDVLFNFTSRLIIATNCLITELDIIILMRTFIFVMERFKGDFQLQICDLLKKLFNINAQIQDNTLQFWINYMMNHSPSQTLNDCILSLLMKCYDNKLNDHLVALARIPAVHKNQLFLNFLTKKCHSQRLTAYGFNISAPTTQQNNKPKQEKMLLTDLGGPENMIPIEPAEMMSLKEMFLQNSQYLLTRLNQLSTLDPYSKVQTYVKTLYSILSPFFSGEIPFINVFEFIKELVKVTAEPYQYKKRYLRELTRMLLFMLVDLDQKPPHGSSCQEMTKQVNRCILNMLQTSKTRHMMEILYLLAKRHLELNISTKMVQIIIKCIGKTVRYNDFASDVHENVRYIFEQNNQIFQQFNISPDSPYMRTLKVTYSELLKLYPAIAQPLLTQMINHPECHPTVLTIYQEFISARREPEPQPLAEQNRDVSNIANSLSSIRAMGPVSIKKLTTLKKTEQQA